MQTLRFMCRVEKKVQNHTVFSDLGADAAEVLVQCRGCGVMGVELRSKASSQL